jgi:hypothetical protein
MDYIRDSQLGHLIRAITRNKVLRWPEELPGFEFPVIEGSAAQGLDAQARSDGNVAKGERDRDIEQQKGEEFIAPPS